MEWNHCRLSYSLHLHTMTRMENMSQILRIHKNQYIHMKTVRSERQTRESSNWQHNLSHWNIKYGWMVANIHKSGKIEVFSLYNARPTEKKAHAFGTKIEIIRSSVQCNWKDVLPSFVRSTRKGYRWQTETAKYDKVVNIQSTSSSIVSWTECRKCTKQTGNPFAVVRKIDI